MKILIISQRYYPEDFRINEISRELVRRGNEVTVLTGLPNYPSGIIPKEYRFFRNRKQDIEGVKVIRSMEIGRKNGAIGLMLNYGSFMVSSAWKAIVMKKDYDIVLVYQLSPVTMMLPGVLVKKIKKIPMFVYTLDLWPESVKNIIKNEKNIIFRAANFISRRLYRNADEIAVTSKPFQEYLVSKHGIEDHRISYLAQHAEAYPMNLQGVDNGVVDFMFLGNWTLR